MNVKHWLGSFFDQKKINTVVNTFCRNKYQVNRQRELMIQSVSTLLLGSNISDRLLDITQNAR